MAIPIRTHPDPNIRISGISGLTTENPECGRCVIPLLHTQNPRLGASWSYKRMCVLSCSVVSGSLRPARLLCPWDFSGKNTGVDCHFLLQGIFLIQGLKLCLLHWQADSLPLSYLGRPHDSDYLNPKPNFFFTHWSESKLLPTVYCPPTHTKKIGAGSINNKIKTVIQCMGINPVVIWSPRENWAKISKHSGPSLACPAKTCHTEAESNGKSFPPEKISFFSKGSPGKTWVCSEWPKKPRCLL